MTLDDFSALIAAHKWLAASPFVIGMIVRMLKSDMPGFDLPARYRAWAALGLGIVSGVIEKHVNGTDWKTALLWGLGAGMTAIVGHETIVEGLRNGKEVGGKKDGGAPPPGGISLSVPPVVTDKDGAPKPTSSLHGKLWGVWTRLWTLAYSPALERIGMILTATVFTGAVVAGFAVQGCQLFKDAATPNNITNAVLSVEQAACVILQSEMGSDEPQAIAAICKIDPKLISEVVKLFTASKSAKAQYQHRDGGTDASPPDAAADASRDSSSDSASSSDARHD